MITEHGRARRATPARRSGLLTGLVLALGSTALLGTACGEGATRVEPANPDPVADAQPGRVGTPPPNAQVVEVALTEWAVAPSVTAVEAGPVYFLAANNGREPHELLVLRSDLAPGDLPVNDGRVPEDEVNMIGEIKPFAAGSEASIVFDLKPGSYVLLCNIVEIKDGELESHYEQGMYAPFTVE